MKKIAFIRLLALCVIFFPKIILAATTSDFPPPKEKLGTYVVDDGSGLDTGCSFRSEGPLLIKLIVPATMNPDELNADGTLKDPTKLITNKVIENRAKISFPVYDIDDKANTSGNGFSPEIDKISFNSVFIKNLSGQDSLWTDDSFYVDIGKIKFKSDKTPNAYNEIRIDIDTANVGNGEYWCMAVDWVAIEYDAAAPYVLAHGINAQENTWDEAAAPGVLTTMDKSGVLYERFSTGKNGSVAANSKDLKNKILDFLKTVKSDKVNIIAHSKGGLDSQALAKLSSPEFKVLSLSTLSTPHRGSVVADLTLLQRQKIDKYVNQGQDPKGYAQQFVNLDLAGWASREKGAGPQPPGLNDLTTQAATAAILNRVRGNVSNTFTIGADAGPKCTRQPTDTEIEPLSEEAPFGTKGYTNDALRLAYQLICDFSSGVQLSVATVSGLFSNTTTLTYSTVTSTSKQANDIVVGARSANPGWGTPLGDDTDTNHSEVKNADNIQLFLDRTIKLR